LFGDVVADQTEVDDVTAGAKLGRRLDEHHLVTGFSQPVSERRTGDAHPVDDNPHLPLGRPNVKASSRSAPRMDIPHAAGPWAAHSLIRKGANRQVSNRPSICTFTMTDSSGVPVESQHFSTLSQILASPTGSPSNWSSSKG